MWFVSLGVWREAAADLGEMDPESSPWLFSTSGHLGQLCIFNGHIQIYQAISVYFKYDAGAKESQGLLIPANYAFNADFPNQLLGSSVTKKEKLLPWQDKNILSW